MRFVKERLNWVIPLPRVRLRKLLKIVLGFIVPSITIAWILLIAYRSARIAKLEHSLRERDYRSVKLLLEDGMDPDTVFYQYAATDRWAILKYQLTGKVPQDGFLPDIGPFEQRFSALTYASGSGDITMAKLLLEHGASLRPRTCNMVPLDSACSAAPGNPRILTLLHNYGADLNSSSACGRLRANALHRNDLNLIDLLTKLGMK